MSMTRQEGEALAKIIDFLATRDDDLANKLRDVVKALVLADAALAERIEAIEEFLLEPVATQPHPPAEPSRLQRVLRFLWSPAS